jgi:hypothetical protein
MARAKKTARPAPVTDDDVWNRWRNDMERIYKENVAAFRNRLVFREFLDIITRNDRLRNEGGYFVNWVFTCYARDQALAVRREVDESGDAINLLQLMNQMISLPEVMSRARYKAHFSDESVFSEEMKDDMFSEAAGHAEHISRAVISEDRKRLLNACEPVATYVSKLIAHRTPIEELSLNIGQIDTALDAIEGVFQKYMTLLTGRGVMGLEPAVQFNWQDIFTYAWAPPPPEDE